MSKSSTSTHWEVHPGVRGNNELTRGERAADRLRNSMGSWAFVGSFIVFMILWASANIFLPVSWDRYPFILLNLFLSMLAGLQGAILLIAAKRQDQIASELATHDHEMTVRIHQWVEEIHTHLDPDDETHISEIPGQ
jgi:uncharacterized membrane protein